MVSAMQKSGVQVDLLEFLTLKSCCMYLSDLHNRENLLSVQHAVRGLDTSLFSLAEWNDAVQYITGEDVSFPSREEAVQYLMNRRDRRAAE